ncbi:MAG TPA: hypothetical protein VHB21_01705, partial [Minicystis sp.]|nr:hypothetical protein [Minicystis sp.]
STLETPLPKITPPLPFAPAAASHAPSEKKPGGGPPPKRAPSSLGTTMPQQTIVPSPALPFRAPAPHELTLDQYASLCATLEAFPDKTAIILQRYGMTDPRDIDRLHETWQARFVNDTASLDAWTRHVAEIRARLRGKG